MARFVEISSNLGVDSVKQGHEWMMVPKGETNLVRLLDGDGYTVKEASRGRLDVADVTKQFQAEVQRTFGPLSLLMPPNARVIRVRGLSAGEAQIAATKGTDRLTLSVSVHPRKPLKIAFFFLQDRGAAGRATSRTTFTPTAGKGWVADLNRVFGPQANIWFDLGRSEYLPIDGLSEWVGSDSDIKALSAARLNAGAPIVVFIAGPKVKTPDKNEPLGFFDPPTKIIVVQDQFVTDTWAGRTAPMLKTIAHEIGHYLNHASGGGQGHDFFRSNGYNSDILNTLDGGDIKISRQRVLDWNPW